MDSQKKCATLGQPKKESNNFSIKCLLNLKEDNIQNGNEKYKKKTLLKRHGGSGKRIRTIFTTEQLQKLETCFQVQQYMVRNERMKLAESLGLAEPQPVNMFSGMNYNKLKTNLRLAVSRLKLLEKKKAELTQKARKEIADFISNDKEDRARIRVEHIVREDYLIESFELIEMYCDLLGARFGMIEQMKNVDPGMEEAIASILWAAPRLQTEVPELKVISDQLTAKYGKPYAEACRENSTSKVNPKLINKLSVSAPPKILVEKYMIEIAKSHNIPFIPDANVVLQDEAATAEAMLIDFQNRGERGYGWAGPPNPTGMVAPPGGAADPSMFPNTPANVQQNNARTEHHQQPFNYPNKQSPQSPPDEYKVPLNEGGRPTAPPPYTTLPPFNHLTDSGDSFPGDGSLPGQNVTTPTEGKDDEMADGDDLNFDDLNRRFEELKKKR